MSLCLYYFWFAGLLRHRTEQTEIETNKKKRKRQVRNENIYDSCVDQQLNEKVGEGERECEK